MKMLKRLVFISCLVLSLGIFSYAQENKMKTNEDIFKQFMGVMETQDESVLLQAIESGNTEIKALCFEVLAKKGIGEKTAIVLDRYITYGLDYTKPVYDNYPAWIVRYRVAMAMANAKLETFVSPLSQLLYLENENSVILAAIYALGEIGSINGTEAVLTQMTLTKSPAVVYEATIALGKIGDARALAQLMNVAQNKMFSMEIQTSAIDAISKLKK